MQDEPVAPGARVLLAIVGGFAAILHRFAGALCILVPLLTIAGVFAVLVVGKGTQAADAATLLVIAAGFLLFLLALSVWLAGRAHQHRLDRDHSEFSLRLETVRDWHMRGDITEEQYARFRTTLDPLRQGQAASSRFRQVGGQAVALGAGFLLAVPGLLSLAVVASDELGCDADPCPEQDAMMGGLMAAAGIALVAALVSFLTAGVLLPLSRRQRGAHLARLDDLTEAALARSRAVRQRSPKRA